MGPFESLLLDHYRSQPYQSLTLQEVDEYIYLLVKQGLERRANRPK